MKYGQVVLQQLILAIFFQIAQIGYPLAQSAGPDGCNIQAVHNLGYTGQGVSIGLISLEHCLISHEAFYDKDAEGNPIGDSHAHWYDPTSDTANPYEPSGHDTSIAGILASRGGKLYPDFLGMAPDSEVYSSKITKVIASGRVTYGPWFKKSLDHFRDNQCRIVVTGIQLSLEDDNEYPFTLLYDYYAYQYDMIFANAAGNDKDSPTIFGTAWNGITTAGLVTTEPDAYRRVGSRSNPGPTTDGRLKPDISGPAKDLRVPTTGSDTAWKIEGFNGETSWSAPHTAGVAAALVGYANASLEPDDGHGVVIKAVLINSAFPNVLDKSGNSTTGQIWDPSRGYGRLDALRALQLLSRPKIVPDLPTEQTAGWAYQTLQPSQTHTYQISGIPVQNRLVVTLTWHRRVQWKDKWPRNGIIDPGELTAYPADLDLYIDDPGGQPCFTDQLTQGNLEKADFLISQSGDYQIRVINQSGSETATYALAYEQIEPIPADFNVDSIVNGDDLSELSFAWLQDPHLLNDESRLRLDLIPDGIIDLNDFSHLVQFWLMTDPRYYPWP